MFLGLIIIVIKGFSLKQFIIFFHIANSIEEKDGATKIKNIISISRAHCETLPKAFIHHLHLDCR